MRASQTRLLLALAAAGLACAARAGAWDPVVSLNGESVRLDKSRISRSADGRATAWSRLTPGQEMIDEAGMRYTAVDALNRYNCEKHSFATLKRVYRRDGKVVRTEPVGVPREMSAEPGSVDDKLLNAVCRSAPAQASASDDVGVPVVDAKPTILYADVRSAEPAKPGQAEAKAPEKPEGKPERPRFIDMPKIDKSKVEDPNAPPKGADAKDEKPAKPEKAPAKAAPERPVERPSASRAELERQYAASGPRRVAKPKRAEPAEAFPEREVHWSYEGAGAPANWAKLRPEYATCAAGKRQSPIDIRDTIHVDLEPIKFAYKPSHVTIIDNGHTVEATVEEGSTMRVMERDFQLVQFHFHKPGEERINGRMFDMVVHLVHRDDAGRIAVIAVPLEKGAENPLIQWLWNNLPLDKDQPISPSAPLDLNLLLPPPDKRAYFTYMGSLTTPPCTEDVLWMVFKQPMPISSQQIGVFSHLYLNNARPIQPSNGRLIKENR
ncbi:MAG TPA: surface-adhesin E family protein [Rhodocyclaceae bacterium]